MASQIRDYEDQLKLLAPKNALKFRQEKCDKCSSKGENKFCQENLQYLPDFQQYRYNACPKKLWLEVWSS
jgi:hypothetical protein